MKTAQSNIFCLKYVKDLCNMLFENCIVSLSYVNEYKVWFVTDIYIILIFLYIINTLVVLKLLVFFLQ